MRYAFFGSPEFAAIILERLSAVGYPPALLICNPDRAQGRKHILTPPPAKVTAEKTGIPVLQPEKPSLDTLKAHGQFDFFLVAAYSKIIPEEILSYPRLGTIGVHPSLLPELRGPSPIQYAIIKGYKETGASLFLVDAKVDHGPILGRRGGIKTDGKYFNELVAELAEASARLVVEVLPDFLSGKIEPISQDENLVTFTKKIATEDGFIEERELNEARNGVSEERALKIDRLVHALNPDPGVYTVSEGKRMKILKSRAENGRLFLERIQWEGKTPIDIKS